MSRVIGSIVEGHGEGEAVPTLIRRIEAEISPSASTRILRPIRISKYKLVKPGELERATELAIRITGRPSRLVVVLDADQDCPAQQGPALLARIRPIAGDLAAVVLAKREFESWFIAAATSLRGCRGLSDRITPPTHPETIAGAKEWLSAHMSGQRRYSATLDQPALAAQMDLGAARSASSFDKFFREVERLLTV